MRLSRGWTGKSNDHPAHRGVRYRVCLGVPEHHARGAAAGAQRGVSLMAEAFTVIHPLRNWSESGGWLAVYSGSNGPYEHAGRDGVDANGPAATAGAPVYACQAGRPLVNHSGDGWGDGSFGTCVRIDHPQGDGAKWSITAHLERNTVAVEGLDWVEQGQLIGFVGLTGLTDGYHVHWALQSGGGGGFAPERYMSGGVWRVGNPGLLDPYAFLAPAQGPPAPVLSVEARLARLEADNAELRAIIARMDNQAVVLGPDGQGYSPLESVRKLNAVVKGHLEAHPGASKVPAHIHEMGATGNVIEAKG